MHVLSQFQFTIWTKSLIIVSGYEKRGTSCCVHKCE